MQRFRCRVVMIGQGIERAVAYICSLKKTAQGRFDTSALLMRPKPTWNLLDDKEMIA